MLFKTKENCYGCGACENICPANAIIMRPDDDGFLYPHIDSGSCKECGRCEGVCISRKKPDDGQKPLAVYAAVNRKKSMLKTSASGGVFAALAKSVIEKGGVVFGCAYNENLKAEHICIRAEADISKLQGSKYVQSNMNDCFPKAKKHLEAGRTVLFTGTPCQVAGLKSYLNREYDKLITVDLVCHGVPSAAFLKGYIHWLELKLQGQVTGINFRDKSKGWGLLQGITYQKKGVVHKKLISPVLSCYYGYFINGDIYRESCYICQYANENRQGDFSMGDFWGIKEIHPEIDAKAGVSVLLVNSRKGMKMMESLSGRLHLTETTFAQAKAGNGQLRKPTSRSPNREAILKTFREEGFRSVADGYHKNMRRKILVFRIKKLIPRKIKKAAKNIFTHR